jgi:excisionase family DNA binding protein
VKAQAAWLREVPRLALTPDEAATSLGVSRSFFYEHILPDLRVIRVGRKRLISVGELKLWTERKSTRILD